jgi:hypothetical protein
VNPLKFFAGLTDLSSMEFVSAILSTLASVFAMGLVVAGVMKLFQIHGLLTEIRDSLRSGQVAGQQSTVSAAPQVRAPQTTARVAEPPARAAAPKWTPEPERAPAPVKAAAPLALHSMASGDEMLRALDEQMQLDEIESRSQTH